MFARGLKSHIAVNMAVFLLLGMALINFVTVMTAQRNILDAEKKRIDALISMIEIQMLDISDHGEGQIRTGLIYNLDQLFEQAKLDCVIILDGSQQVIYRGGTGCEIKDECLMQAGDSIQSVKKTIRFSGKTWGVFWKQSKYLIVSSPLYKDQRMIGGIGTVLSLDELYGTLRNSQKVLWIYIIINTFIFTCIGIFRISRAYIYPMKRLVSRAEEYTDEDEIFFTVRKEDNELSQLTKALNSMLERISKDKKKLKSTVDSLESTNRDLRLAQTEIMQSEKLASIGRLTSGIAHEIGNPIGIIIGYLELLKQKDITEDEKDDYIVRTKEEINRINTIIRQLLDLSRPSKLEAQKVSAHDIIYEIGEMVKPQPFMNGIDMEIRLEAEKDMVVVDSNQIRQVFLNLIINAADAILSVEPKKKGKLIIRSRIETEKRDLKHKDDHPIIKIIFTDNGPGIPEEKIADIFDPFFTTKEPGKGTGLGLWVNCMIIEGMNGNISAESIGNEGTSITIQLPLYIDDDTRSKEL